MRECVHRDASCAWDRSRRSTAHLRRCSPPKSAMSTRYVVTWTRSPRIDSGGVQDVADVLDDRTGLRRDVEPLSPSTRSTPSKVSSGGAGRARYVDEVSAHTWREEASRGLAASRRRGDFPCSSGPSEPVTGRGPPSPACARPAPPPPAATAISRCWRSSDRWFRSASGYVVNREDHLVAGGVCLAGGLLPARLEYSPGQEEGLRPPPCRASRRSFSFATTRSPLRHPSTLLVHRQGERPSSSTSDRHWSARRHPRPRFAPCPEREVRVRSIADETVASSRPAHGSESIVARRPTGLNR